YRPGSWAYNAFEVTVDSAREYEVGVKPADTNPSHAEFRARAVVHDMETSTRTYHEIPIARTGEPSSIRVPAGAGQKLYLVVAATPSTMFEGIEQYAYSYLIRPAE